MATRKYKDGGRVPIPDDPAVEPVTADVPAPAEAASTEKSQEPNVLAEQLEAFKRAEELNRNPPPPKMSERQTEFMTRNPHLQAHGRLLGQLHQAILQSGVPEDSDQYFSEMRLGLDQVGVRHDQPSRIEPSQPEQQAPPLVAGLPPPLPDQRRSAPVSAPVRGGYNIPTAYGADKPGRITLSPQQREAARIAGVDEFTYAKGILELERRKKQGMYPDKG